VWCAAYNVYKPGQEQKLSWTFQSGTVPWKKHWMENLLDHCLCYNLFSHSCFWTWMRQEAFKIIIQYYANFFCPDTIVSIRADTDLDNKIDVWLVCDNYRLHSMLARTTCDRTCPYYFSHSLVMVVIAWRLMDRKNPCQGRNHSERGCTVRENWLLVDVNGAFP